MIRFLIIFSCLSCVAQDWTAFDQAAMQSWQQGVSVVSEVFDFDFEETGTPAGVTVVTGSPNFDYTTTILSGAQSCYMSGATADIWRYDYANADSILCKFKFRVLQIPGTTATPLMFSVAGADTYNYQLWLHSTGILGVVVAGSTVYTTDPVVVGTTYYVWLRFTKGTGANAFGSVEFSTTNTETQTGNKYISKADGNRTTQLGRLRLQTNDVAVDAIWIIDDFVRIVLP